MSKHFKSMSFFLLITVVCLSVCVGAQPVTLQYILGISKTDHVLAIIDPVSLKVVNRIPVGEDPHEVQVSDDGKVAYVSNTGGGVLHEINVIDVAGQRQMTNIDTKPLLGPHGMAYNSGKLWFTAQGSKSVGRYDPVSGAIEWTVGTGQDMTHMLRMPADVERFYTTNVESGTVSIFEHKLLQPTMPPTGKLPPNAKAHMDWVQTIIPAGKGVEGFDVSPDDKVLWAAKPDGSIAIIDINAKKITKQLKTGVLGLHRLKFSPDGKRVLVVSVRTGDLLVYDAKTCKLVKRMQVGHGAGIMMDKTGNRAFISCTPDNYVAVVDLSKLQVTTRLDIGGRPDGMAIAEWMQE